MFNDYEIKNVNGEEVLFLFIDYKTEFAKMDKVYKKATINDEINDYMDKKKIKFDGKKIILMAGSLVVGACLLNAPISKTEAMNYNYTTNIVSVENIDNILAENTKETIEEIKQESNTNDSKKSIASSSNKSTSKNSASTNSKPSSNTNISSVNSNTSSNATTTIKNVNPNNTQNSSANNTTPTPKGQIVTVKRSNGSVLNIELEEYLIGVVAAEMPASFHIEALKAQAIAARTYTLKAIQNNITLTDTVSTQVYKDNNELKAIWGTSYNAYYEKVKNAVAATKGLVITYNGSLINAYYHSTSNGMTEDGSFVFGEAPYLKSVESKFDVNVSSFSREVTFTYEDISNKLGVPITPQSSITIDRNSSNRVSKIVIDNNTYDGVKFRMTLGLRSTDFEIELLQDQVSIKTKGYGHGVGMSQYGANEYAKIGWNYNQILTHYYTGTTIKAY